MFVPLQKPCFTIETFKHMAAPQFIELSSYFCPQALFLFDCILWWAVRSDNGRHAEWNRLVYSGQCTVYSEECLVFIVQYVL